MSGSFGLDVYSTFARDVLIDASTKQRREQPGGPAFFIERALEAAGASFSMHAGSVVEVEILVTKAGEFGRVRPIASPEAIPACGSRRALVSTLFREWDPETIADECDEVYVDAQGFVRAPGSFGKKQAWERFDGDWIRKVSVLKATEEELGHIPAHGVEDQKRRILLVTKGKAGCTAFVNGRAMDFVPPRVVVSEHTLGAGDTFFATVLAHLVRGVPADRAIALGMDATVRLLETFV